MLKSLKIDLRTQDLNLGYAKNQLLPRLDLTASYYSPGISGDRIIYLDDNPLTGVIIGVVPGPAKNARSDAFNFKYKNWSVGLTLDIPLNAMFSRASVAQAKLNLEQAMLRLKNQEQMIYLEIRNGVRSVETNYQRVQSYRVARELAEKKLQAEEEKLKAGYSTSYFVLQYQSELSLQQSQELEAMIEYRFALAKLSRALGISLVENNIRIGEMLKK